MAGWRKLKEQSQLEQKHPAAPWLWRDDWASGRISDSNRGLVIGAWMFAAFWNLVSLPAAFVGVRSALTEGNHAALVALLFPLVGLGLLVWATRLTLRYRKYGISQLQLATIPGVVGRTLAGIVAVPGGPRPAEGFLVTLSCVRRSTSGAGRNRSSSENILWQDERRVPGNVTRDPSGMVTNVPVAFRIPPDATVTDTENPRNQVLWRLRVSAEVPGVDYDSSFEVPVFRTPASEQPLTEQERQLTAEPTIDDTYRQPADSRIVVTTNRRGTEVMFPAARNLGIAGSLTVLTLIWWAAIAFQIYLRIPKVFPIVFGVVGILLILVVLDLWLRVSRVTTEGGSMTVATGYLVPTRERRLGASEIADLAVESGMRSGRTTYYDITVVTKDGSKVRLGKSLRDKREADWLVTTLKKALANQ